MHTSKYNRIKNLYNGFKGNQTYHAVFSQLTDDLKDKLSAKQLAKVMELIDASYQKGKASCKAEVFDDCFWIGDGVDKLLPKAALKAINIEEKYITEECHGCPGGFTPCKSGHTTVEHTYTLNFKE